MQTIGEHLSECSGKRVIVRCNFDVPLHEGAVQDTTRIEDSLATIRALKKAGANVLLVAHAGRPEGPDDTSLSLLPVAELLTEMLGEQVDFVPYTENLPSVVIDQPIMLLENIRFWSGESRNTPEFSQALANLADVYVNECFAACHRDHASITGVARLLPAYAGISLTHEVSLLTNVRDHPEQPLVVVLGGAKLATKEPLIDVFQPIASHILVGGKLAVDLEGRSMPDNVHVAALVDSKKDITPKQAAAFAVYIQEAKTILWNGSMGVTEEEAFREGTRIVGEAICSTPAFTVVGGGDTEAALTVLNLEHGIDHISSGGGAMLALLSKQAMPGLAALSEEA